MPVTATVPAGSVGAVGWTGVHTPLTDDGHCALQGSASFNPDLGQANTPNTREMSASLSACAATDAGPLSGTLTQGVVYPDDATHLTYQVPERQRHLGDGRRPVHHHRLTAGES